MKRLLWLLAFFPALVWAGNNYNTLDLAAPAQIRSAQPTVPTCSSGCGTSPSVTGTDSAGTIKMGSTGSPTSGFVINFNYTWPVAPSCLAQSALSSMVAGKSPIAVVSTTTQMTITTNGTAPGNSDVYAYHCIGTQ